MARVTPTDYMGGKSGSDFKQKKQHRGEEEKHVHLDGEREGE